MAPLDTSPAANAAYHQRLAAMTPSERLRIGVSLWQTAWSLQRAALLRSHPDATEAEIAFHIAVSRFGPDLARLAYRGA